MRVYILWYHMRCLALYGRHKRVSKRVCYFCVFQSFKYNFRNNKKLFISAQIQHWWEEKFSIILRNLLKSENLLAHLHKLGMFPVSYWFWNVVKFVFKMFWQLKVFLRVLHATGSFWEPISKQQEKILLQRNMSWWQS
jgi:hypothetical protein